MKLQLRYNNPSPDNDNGWEKYSLPIGCSHLGGNIFGGVEYERIQITENSLMNAKGGLNSFANLYIHFPHTESDISDYERSLDISESVAKVKYICGDNNIEREYFATYPDRAIVGKIKTSKKTSLVFELKIAHLTEEPEIEKYGKEEVSSDTITIHGTMKSYNIRFNGQLKIRTDGQLKTDGTSIIVEDSLNTEFIFCGATNYELSSNIFTEQDKQKKLRDIDPHDKVCDLLQKAASYTYEELKQRHQQDYKELFDRVSLEFKDCEIPEETTDKLVESYKDLKSRYLEILYFQYGRYLLISSSRKGALPANLQGVWNCHEKAPWGGTYFHNINVQMNYWPAFITNIGETFDSYLDYNLAARQQAYSTAANYIQAVVPENYDNSERSCGWAFGAVTTPYEVYNISSQGSSGPGTSSFTAKMIWELYAFTKDKNILRNTVYPAVRDSAKFMMKCTCDFDGKQLVYSSTSPEQTITLGWDSTHPYYTSVGCAFDQQMLYENASDFLKCVEILGEDTLPAEDIELADEIKKKLNSMDPVLVGWSGQIKEYREEKFYGEIGEYRHRHISQLVGLYPGTHISSETPAWLDAAKKTLDLRSDESTGWALAHRLNAWARTGDGNRSYKLYSNLLGHRTYPNLWDTHPPFQIDGNFGGTSGVAELLLQSHETYIRPLAALPDAWADGSYKGLVARGNFVFDVTWKNGCAETISVHSQNGNICRINYKNISKATFSFNARITDKDKIEFDTEAGETYKITNIPSHKKLPTPKDIRVSRKPSIYWDFEEPVNIWRAYDSSPTYDLIASGICANEYYDNECVPEEHETVTYKITRYEVSDPTGEGAYATINRSTKEDRTRYRFIIRQLSNGEVNPPEYLGE